eukprot:COSAG06_NODE_39744_length_409_cov_0.858065_1_plen_81_part_10
MNTASLSMGEPSRGMMAMPKANASRAHSVSSRARMTIPVLLLQHSHSHLYAHAGSRCVNGECQTGTGGKGCAACVEGFFTA